MPAADHETSFFDGMDVTLSGIAALASGDTQFLKDGLSQISRLAADALKQYVADRPAAIAPLLVARLGCAGDSSTASHRCRFQAIRF